MKKLVFIEDIDLDSSPKVRAELQREASDDYAHAYKSKKQLPLPHVFQPNGSKHFLLADGRHRIAALKLIGQKATACEVHTGNYEECLKFALLANEVNGLRRTNADKRVCVEAALNQWPDDSSRELAEKCGVSHTFVDSCRKPEVATVATPVSGERQSKGENNAEKSVDKPKSGKPQPADPQPETEPEAPAVPVDTMGFPIPKVSLPFWERRQEIQELMTAVSKVRVALKRSHDSRDQLLGDLHGALGDSLTRIYMDIADRKPDVVCPYCVGTFKYRDDHGVRDCLACRQSGLLSKTIYEKTQPQFKAKRESALKK
jgi:hypothetical protein